jgi:hypothetical protein
MLLLFFFLFCHSYKNPQGLITFDDIFDGRYKQALSAAGCNIANNHPCVIFHHPSSGIQPWMRHVKVKEDLPVAICTRHMFETTARQLLRENPRVQFVYGLDVTGLLFEDGGGAEAGQQQRVTGAYTVWSGRAYWDAPA